VHTLQSTCSSFLQHRFAAVPAYCEVSPYAMLLIKDFELIIRVFSPFVCLEALDLPPGLVVHFNINI
jgi:hypothetical protein